MRIARDLLLAFVVLAATACDAPSEAPKVDGVAQQFAPETVAVFPSAAEARLFAYADAPIGVDGVIPVGDRQEGVLLHAVELQRLQSLIRTAPIVDPAACPCTWRHVVTFYEESGARLGDLAICLECQCAARRVAPSNEVELLVNGYAWDETVVREILAAHNVPSFDGENDG